MLYLVITALSVLLSLPLSYCFAYSMARGWYRGRMVAVEGYYRHRVGREQNQWAVEPTDPKETDNEQQT